MQSGKHIEVEKMLFRYRLLLCVQSKIGIRKPVFRYDSVLRYGIVQSKKPGEVLALLGMFCSSSKLCVLSVRCRLHSCGKWSAGQGGAAFGLAELVLLLI